MKGKKRLRDRKEEIENLVLKSQEGDEASFIELYDILLDPIYQYIHMRVPNTEVEDLTEVVFMKMWEHLHSYQSKGNLFVSWIFKIAHNVVVDFYKSQKRDVSLEDVVIEADNVMSDPKARSHRSLNSVVLKKALDNIPDSYAEVLTLKFLDQMDNDEISKILEKSEGSIRVMQHRALKELKKVLMDMGMENYY